MSIQDLPNELLNEICLNLDTVSLLNMSETYSRNYKVCFTHIQKKKKNKLKNCLRKAALGIPITDENILRSVQLNTKSEELKTVITDLYPIFLKEDTEIVIFWISTEYEKVITDQITRWYNMIIDRLTTEESMYSLALISQQYIDSVLHQIEYRDFEDCIPYESRIYYKLTDNDKYWFTEEDKIQRNIGLKILDSYRYR